MFHLFRRNKSLLGAADEEQIVNAIKEAERTTSGELRVFIESRCAYVDAMDRAREIFFKLKMEQTALHNGVLIYVALTDRQIALFGDEGIYKKTNGDPYWHGILKMMRASFKEGKIAEGIAKAALQVGRTLAEHFPYDEQTDKNELPDDIVFGR